jgi:hypothetical protein
MKSKKGTSNAKIVIVILPKRKKCALKRMDDKMKGMIFNFTENSPNLIF